MRSSRLWAAPAAALLVMAGCSDEGPIAPADSGGGSAAEYLACQVDVRSGEIGCASLNPALGDGALAAVIGGQGVYVQLISNNVAYDEANEIFSANVQIHNLSNQVLGSADGVTVAAGGVKIFFVDQPVTTGGTGAVTVANATGTDNFTKAGQEYFGYEQALAPGQTSLGQTWEWNVPSTVTQFTFLVGVSAEVQDQAGFEPGLKFQASGMAGDSQHTCVLTLDGQAYCWGAGVSGKLGNDQVAADTLPFLSPQKVQQGSLRFASIAAGLHHTCALTTEGDAYCWGSQANGRLGNGLTTSANVRTPVPVNGGHKFIQLVAGRRFNCGITVDLDAYCWGATATARDFSPIGDGTSDDRPEPTLVLGGHKWLTLGAGKYHTCGITTNYETYCWGQGGQGRLGTGNSLNTFEPALVQSNHKFVKIDGGNNHTCALTDQGEAWCWGSGANHRLGTGTTDTVFVPAKVATDVKFVDIHAMQYHTCALAVDGRAFCWGSNTNGKGGIGTSGGEIETPTEVTGGHTFVELAGGLEATCGKTAAGEVYCWGRNNFGQLGDGSKTNRSSPTLVLPFPE